MQFIAVLFALVATAYAEAEADAQMLVSPHHQIAAAPGRPNGFYYHVQTYDTPKTPAATVPLVAPEAETPAAAVVAAPGYYGAWNGAAAAYGAYPYNGYYGRAAAAAYNPYAAYGAYGAGVYGAGIYGRNAYAGYGAYPYAAAAAYNPYSAYGAYNGAYYNPAVVAAPVATAASTTA